MSKTLSENDYSKSKDANSNKNSNNQLTVISLESRGSKNLMVSPTQAKYFNSNAYGEIKFLSTRKTKVLFFFC
jgi:hypothetical protein